MWGGVMGDSHWLGSSCICLDSPTPKSQWLFLKRPSSTFSHQKPDALAGFERGGEGCNAPCSRICLNHMRSCTRKDGNERVVNMRGSVEVKHIVATFGRAWQSSCGIRSCLGSIYLHTFILTSSQWGKRCHGRSFFLGELFFNLRK